MGLKAVGLHAFHLQVALSLSFAHPVLNALLSELRFKREPQEDCVFILKGRNPGF